MKNSNISQSYICAKEPQTAQIRSMYRLQIAIFQNQLRDITPFSRGPAQFTLSLFLKMGETIHLPGLESQSGNIS